MIRFAFLRRLLPAVGLALALGACTPSNGVVFTRITSEQASGTGTVFSMENRGRTFAMAFPQGWKAMHIAQQDGADPGDDLITHGSPRAGFGINAVKASFPEGEPSNDWQYGVLDELRASLASKSPDQFTWIGSTWTTITGDPALQTTVLLKDGTRARDTYFFYDDLLLTASFVCEDGAFDNLWPAAWEAMRNMQLKS